MNFIKDLMKEMPENNFEKAVTEGLDLFKNIKINKSLDKILKKYNLNNAQTIEFLINIHMGLMMNVLGNMTREASKEMAKLIFHKSFELIIESFDIYSRSMLRDSKT